jgi:hypothetical protein
MVAACQGSRCHAFHRRRRRIEACPAAPGVRVSGAATGQAPACQWIAAGGGCRCAGRTRPPSPTGGAWAAVGSVPHSSRARSCSLPAIRFRSFARRGVPAASHGQRNRLRHRRGALRPVGRDAGQGWSRVSSLPCRVARRPAAPPAGPPCCPCRPAADERASLAPGGLPQPPRHPGAGRLVRSGTEDGEGGAAREAQPLRLAHRVVGRQPHGSPGGERVGAAS